MILIVVLKVKLWGGHVGQRQGGHLGDLLFQEKVDETLPRPDTVNSGSKGWGRGSCQG